MAFIYKISNDINDKLYIGKTEFSIEKRFKEHCKDAFKIINEKRPLYAAMRKYGIEHFNIEKIEETDQPEEREVYWINYYNSYHNGYNATLGGDGKKYLDYDFIYSTYLKIKNINDTAQICNCSSDSVSLIIKSKGISEQEIQDNMKSLKSKTVAMLDKDTGEILNIFTGTYEAGKFINKRHQHIQGACQGKRKTAYGYRWQYLD